MMDIKGWGGVGGTLPKLKFVNLDREKGRKNGRGKGEGGEREGKNTASISLCFLSYLHGCVPSIYLVL